MSCDRIPNSRSKKSPANGFCWIILTVTGYNSRYHYYEYDENMNPTGIGYYMTFEGAALDLRIFFDTEGNVDYYKVKYSSFMDDIKSSWQGTPDNPLTVLNGTEIRDTTEADPRIWDPVWFEK